MDLTIKIYPQGTLAIYEQIVMQLKNAIVSGDLKANEALPSIRRLAADLGVSVITTKCKRFISKKGSKKRILIIQKGFSKFFFFFNMN